MKKERLQIMDIRPQVVFEIHNSPGDGDAGDPTTSLGATTFTGLLTVLATFQRMPPPDNQ